MADTLPLTDAVKNENDPSTVKENITDETQRPRTQYERYFSINTQDSKKGRSTSHRNTFLQQRKLAEEQQKKSEDLFLKRIAEATGMPVYDNKLHSTFSFAFMIFDPWERPYYFSLLIASCAVVYNIIFSVARGAFDMLEADHQVLWYACDTVADFCYLFDMFVQSRKGFLQDGIIVTQKLTLLKKYLVSTRFRIDVISILPIEVLCTANVGFFLPKNRPWLRLNRVFRAYRLNECTDRSWRMTSYPNLARLSTQLIYLLLILHWNACAYYEVSEYIGFNSDEWVLNTTLYPTTTERYFVCLYWVALQLTQICEVPQPVIITEYVFVIFNVLFGVCYVVTTIGNIATVMSSWTSKREKYQNWLNDVKRYMRHNGIKRRLMARVQAWFEHNWTENQSAGSQDDALTFLPEKLQTEINMNVHLDTIRKVRLFQDSEPGLLVAIVNKLNLIMFNPGEYICRRGDVGKEMYIVKSGILEVVGPNGVTVFATLTTGSVFGELALLNISGAKTGKRRTASVKSSGYSYIYSLTKENLWDALKDFPGARQAFLDKGREILLKDGLLDETGRKSPFLALGKLGKISLMQKRMEKLLHRMSVTVAGMGKEYDKLNRRLDIVFDAMYAMEKEVEATKIRRNSSNAEKVASVAIRIDGPDEGSDVFLNNN